MKLLVILEKVDINDERFMFMNGQIRDLAQSAESVIVLCLEKRAEFNVPNVRVISLGKVASPATRRGGGERLRYLFNFYRAIISERRNYDKVLVYRTPLYIVLGGLLWRLWHKPIVLWYNHTFQNLMLRKAVLFSNIIVSPSKHGLPLESAKLRIAEGTEFTDLIKNLS